MDEELKTKCRRSENCVLRKDNYDGLSKLNWKEISVETEKNCPTTMPSGIELIMVGGLDERIYMIVNDLSCYEVIKILEESVFTYILINLYQNESDN